MPSLQQLDPPVDVSTSLPTDTHLTEDDTLDKIDAEMARLERQIHIVGQLHNSKVPIARFPAEILSKVFLLCHEQKEPQDSPFKIKARNSRLIISWVSRRWRRVALGYPMLWSYICVFRPEPDRLPSLVEYVRQCLVRSRNASLTIIYEAPLSEAITMFSTQIHRIHTIQIHWASWLKPPLIDAWNHPAPLLAELEFGSVSLSDDLFDGTCPQLQSLSLKSCVHTWDSRITSLSTLTTLKIYDPKEELPPKEIIQKLQALPALRTCYLRHCFDVEATSLGVIMEPPVYLPHLEYISVTDSWGETLIDFLQRLDLSQVSLEAIQERQQIGEGTFADHFAFSEEYQRTVWEEVRKVSVEGGNWAETYVFNVTITFASTPNHHFTFDAVSQCIKFDFDLVVAASPYLLLDQTRELSFDRVSVDGLDSLGPLPTLKALEIENVDKDAEFLDWAIASWRDVFPSVTELKVGGVLYPGFEDFIVQWGGEGLGGMQEGDPNGSDEE
ncbi:hypothetical protein BDN72DRAFT_897971 [Pluteus cervinus]|uniref:Uncharacterized protein n=1 Tax=Pluteus cervinus TaxID=181527 RepID=A0ACD3ASE6_9AGAR|nr:hypothetical protein BDN72DRAFT_897971 [Pluteus cervinus]